MDLQSIIESGILEAYALNQCSPEERETVERMLAQHPALREELTRIELTLEQYAQAHAVTPPSGLKDQILRKVSENADSTTSKGSPATNWRLPALVAAAIMAVIAGVLYLRAIRQNDRLQQENTELRQQNADCLQREQQFRLQEQQIALLQDRETRTVVLTGKQSQTQVYYNPQRREVAIALKGLPTPAPGKYLQFWAILKENPRPQSMGMIDIRSAGALQTFEYVEGAIGFAISEETEPQGRDQPSSVIMTPI